MAERAREALSAIKQWMTKREQEALVTGVSVTLDEALNDLDPMAVEDAPHLSEEARVVDFLPRQYRARSDGRFVCRFLAFLMTLVQKFAESPWTCCRVRRKNWRRTRSSPPRADLDLAGVANSEQAFERLESAIFEDTDVVFHFDAQFEGIEGTEFAAQAGVVNLAFAEWFAPFLHEVVAHPFALQRLYLYGCASLLAHATMRARAETMGHA
jgi:hypothetical protein